MMTLEFKDSGPLTWEEFAERTLQIAREYPGEFYASSFDPDALPPFDPSIRASAWPRLSVATKNGTSRSPANSTPKR